MNVSWLEEWKIKSMDCELSECMLIQPKMHSPLTPFALDSVHPRSICLIKVISIQAGLMLYIFVEIQ